MDGRHYSTSSYWFYGTGCWKEAMKVKSSAFPRNAWYFTKTLYPINSPPRDFTQFNHPNHPLMPTSTYPPSRKTNFTRYSWKLLQAAAFVFVSYTPEIQHGTLNLTHLEKDKHLYQPSILGYLAVSWLGDVPSPSWMDESRSLDGNSQQRFYSCNDGSPNFGWHQMPFIWDDWRLKPLCSLSGVFEYCSM